MPGPRLEQGGPAGEGVPEPAERATARDGDLEEVGDRGVVDPGDKRFHVAVAVARAAALDPQPLPLVVLLVIE